MTYRLAMIGCGVVCRGLMKILVEKGAYLKERYGFEACVTAVSDKFKGSILVPQGLNLKGFIEHLEGGRRVDEFKADGAVYGTDPLETIKRAPADVVIEVTFTDIRTGEPAATHIREALKAGRHVVTTNKGPIALFHRELSELARAHGVHLRHEGVVLSGTPVFNLMECCLAGNEVRELRGILNGTTNFILTKMEEGMEYDEALALAQRMGYAEADPTADVEGYDAMAKVLALAKIVMGAELAQSEVKRQGISSITKEDVAAAANEKMRYKLIGAVRRRDGEVEAHVRPEKLDLADPLASVGGAMNALTFRTDLSGEITIQGAGAGQIETGFALLTDLLTIHRDLRRREGVLAHAPSEPLRIKAMPDLVVERQVMPKGMKGKG
ncbi:MAG: homoserine dehydrogenase [Candidatus Thermoplasmatota archaeon]